MSRVAGLSLAGLVLCFTSLALADEPPTFESKVAEMEKRSGLLTFYADAVSGGVWLEIPAGAEDLVGEYIYVEGLVTGLGSNPVGLDRGQLGDSILVSLRRVGGRLLIEQVNLGYRALTRSASEERATRESFATSVLWAGAIGPTAEDGRSLVDITTFLVRDAHDVSQRLAASEQGTFSLDAGRSVVDLDACLAFPDNLEFEAILTYAGSGEIGSHVRSTAPTPTAVTLVQHHSLIRLPEDGYEPREFDPRAGSFAIEFQDYAAPLAAPIERRWIVRHRLTAGDSLVYYVDPAIPEPVQRAVFDGASWWADAFTAAGFPGAFRVELLPEDAHPLDVRYNVIQWVHRSTRGWSYGGGVVDPRTGEMLKGHVSLGSLRVRQDRLIFEGLVGADRTGTGGDDDPIELSLARIRQLSAHEVGHTLGITHNFAASTYGRESVMDYPAPLVTVGSDGGLDVSQAYAVGIGRWDIHAVRFAYTEFDADEATALEALLAEGRTEGLAFITDEDARPPGAALALGSLWDNGADPVEHLAVEMAVRRVALERFGVDRVRPGTPLALLEEVLATVYFHHRYQLEAALKVVGGMDYVYPMRGDGQPTWRPVSAERQRRALVGVLAGLAPGELDVPQNVIDALHPRPFGYGPNRELLQQGTWPAFDSLAAVATAADMVVSGLLQHERAARLVDFHRQHPDLPGFEEVLRELGAATFGAAPTGATGGRRLGEVARVVEGVVVARLIELAGNPAASLAVRARSEATLAEIGERLGSTDNEHAALLLRQIDRHMTSPSAPIEAAPAAAPAPPGSPIGSGAGARPYDYRKPLACSFDAG